jgi:hypothetical protein
MGRTVQTARTDGTLYSPKRRFIETFFSCEIDDTDLSDLATVRVDESQKRSGASGASGSGESWESGESIERKSSKYVVVHLRESDTRYPVEFRGRLLRGVVLHYVSECDAFVVQIKGCEKFCDIFPRRNVKPSCRAQKIEEVVQENDGRMCRYRLDLSERITCEGEDVSGIVVKARILCKVTDELVLLALPDFNETCSWSGYSVCHIKNEQILW